MSLELSCPISERGLLSGLFNYGSQAYFEISTIINEDCFTIDSNAIIYKILKNLIERDNSVKIDLPLIYGMAKELNLDNVLSKKDEKQHLVGVINLPVEFTNIQKFAAKIKKLYVIRQLKEKCLDIAENKLTELSGNEPITQILGITDEIVDYTSVLGQSEQTAIKLSDNIDDFIQNLIDNPVDMIGYSSGWKRFDAVIGDGFLPGNLHIIGARTGVGKSMICENIAAHTSQKIPTLIVDNELLQEDHLYRSLALLSGVPIKEIKTGKFGKNIASIQKIKQAKEKIKNSNLYYLNVAGMDFIDQLSLIRRWIMKDVGLYKDGSSKPCIVYYDYLKMSDTQGISNNVSEHLLLGVMTTQLLNVAVKFKRPSVVLFVQLNRQGVTLEDQTIIAKSDAILHPASSFSVFKQLTAEEIAETKSDYTHKMITLKARHSSSLGFGDYILYRMRGNIGKIIEGKTALELKESENHHNEDDEQKSFKITNERKSAKDHSVPENSNYNVLRDNFKNDKQEEIDYI